MKFNFKKLFYMKTLLYLASREVYYQCYKIIKHFIHSSYWYCLCDRYQGCWRGPYPVAGNGYCCICITHAHYTLEKLNNVKYDFFSVEKVLLKYFEGLGRNFKCRPDCLFLGK